MIAKPDLSRYRKCPGCGTWQVKLTPCVKCGTYTCIEAGTYIKDRPDIVPGYTRVKFADRDEVYVDRALELIKDGAWHPKAEVLRMVGAYSKTTKRLANIWTLLQDHVEVRQITPRPQFGAWIWIRLKESDDDGKDQRGKAAIQKAREEECSTQERGDPVREPHQADIARCGAYP